MIANGSITNLKIEPGRSVTRLHSGTMNSRPLQRTYSACKASKQFANCSTQFEATLKENYKFLLFFSSNFKNKLCTKTREPACQKVQAYFLFPCLNIRSLCDLLHSRQWPYSIRLRLLDLPNASLALLGAAVKQVLRNCSISFDVHQCLGRCVEQYKTLEVNE